MEKLVAMNDVTIIMPAYNAEKYLEQSVDSVIAQSYRNWKLLIIDDCSTDGTLALAERLAEKDQRISILHNEVNCGVAKTRNRGIQEADTEWIAFLDSDDVWETEKIKRQLLLAKVDVDIVYCSYDLIDENGVRMNRPFIVPTNTNFHLMLTSSVISCSTALVRTRILKEHFFNSSAFHEDYLLWMELLRLPCKAVGDSTVLAYYRQTKDGRNIHKGNAAKERWRIYREYLHLNILFSMFAFLGYSIKGIIKYYL